MFPPECRYQSLPVRIHLQGAAFHFNCQWPARPSLHHILPPFPSFSLPTKESSSTRPAKARKSSPTSTSVFSSQLDSTLHPFGRPSFTFRPLFQPQSSCSAWLSSARFTRQRRPKIVSLAATPCHQPASQSPSSIEIIIANRLAPTTKTPKCPKKRAACRARRPARATRQFCPLSTLPLRRPSSLVSRCTQHST